MSSSRSSEVIYTFKQNQAVLSCDISHLHPELGRLVQTFKEEDDAFPFVGDLRLFVSSFVLYPPDSAIPTNFSRLGREVADKIWQEVFALKNAFLEKKIADIIQHIVKHPFSVERRLELYRVGLVLTNYDIYQDNTNIWLTRKGI